MNKARIITKVKVLAFAFGALVGVVYDHGGARWMPVRIQEDLV